MKNEVRKAYSKYDLPNFDKVNMALEIQAIDTEKYIFINELCRVVINKINFFSYYSGAMFLPGGPYSNIIQNTIKDKEKIEFARVLYKDAMVVFHQALKAEISDDDEEKIKFFNFFWGKYYDFNERTIKILGWYEEVFSAKTKSEKAHEGYVG